MLDFPASLNVGFPRARLYNKISVLFVGHTANT